MESVVLHTVHAITTILIKNIDRVLCRRRDSINRIRLVITFNFALPLVRGSNFCNLRCEAGVQLIYRILFNKT